MQTHPHDIAAAASAALTVLVATLPAQAYDYQAAATYSEQRNGHALIVAIGGQISYERYANGWTQNQAHRLASGTKSFNGVLLAIAVQDGLIASFDERLATALPEWRSDPRKSQITYRQLLGLQSGITGGTTGLQVSYAQSIAAPTIAAPGQVFNYGPIPFQIFGEALKRKLAPQNESVADYIQRRVLIPLGMTVAYWTDWAIGEPRLPGGARMTARDWLPFGEMVRQGGIYNGVRLVPQVLLDECFARSPVKPTYGVSWWLPTRASSEPDDAVTAQGAGKQRLYVIRSHDMVIVRFGESTSWSDAAFIAALMPAAVAQFGQGCTGSAGVPALDAAPGSVPQVGARLDLQLTNLPAASSGAIWIGASNQQFAGQLLPLDLGLLGMPSCLLLASMDVVVPIATGAGSATVGLAIPNDQTLATHSVYLQFALLDPGANVLGVTVSNGAVARIGVR